MSNKKPFYDVARNRKHTIIKKGVTPLKKHWIKIKCPFCFETVQAWAGSFLGTGKKCVCGAIHKPNGYSLTLKEKEK